RHLLPSRTSGILEWNTKLLKLDSLVIMENGVGQSIFFDDNGNLKNTLNQVGVTHDNISVELADIILMYLRSTCFRIEQVSKVTENALKRLTRTKDEPIFDGVRTQLTRQSATEQMRKWQEEMDDTSREVLQELFYQLSGYRISEWGQVIRVEDEEYDPPLNAVGSGVQQLLDLAFDIGNVAQLILIEEPERFLHPELIRHVSNSLREHCHKHNVQMIVATHSPTFLSTRTLNDTWITTKSNNGTICKRVNSNEDLLTIALELGVRLTDVCLAEAILFVEGPSDTIVLSKWFDIIGFPIGWPSVYVVEMNGKDERHHNARIWKPVVEAFPSVRMGWLFDGDLTDSEKEDFERVISTPHKVWKFEKGDIEDYYPIATLKSGIKNLFELSTNQQSEIDTLNRGERLVPQIDRILGRSESWKVKLAQYYSDRCTKPPSSLKPVLNEIKESLFRS
ncbi:MAG: AAA family ATPase, partial [Candidatus Thorarchaeota archaeon]